jgi:hypothetical protein
VIKEQRRQLEQQEKELVDQLRATIKLHTDKLKALGYDLAPEPVKPPPQPTEVGPPPPGVPPFLIPPPPAPTPSRG